MKNRPFTSEHHVKDRDQNVSTNIKSYFQELRELKESRLLDFVSLTEVDVQNLFDAKQIIEQHLSEIVDTFYEQIAKDPHLMEIINQHSTIERLKKTLERYILDMVSGEIGKDYLIRRKLIGNVHNRINLFPEWYLGAYTLIQKAVFSILSRECPTREIAEQTFQSFLKLCSFDMQVAINTYIESYTSSMMKLNEIEELQLRLTESSMTLAANCEETTTSIADKEKQLQSMVEEIDEILNTFKTMIIRVDDGKKNVELSLVEVDNIVNTIENTSELTKELAESSERIGEVIKVIRDISNQTNVLSLNASIESARAGVHGKGFSIVAKEVRNLSHQTRESIERIQEQIKTVQSKVKVFEDSFTKIVEQTSIFKELNKQIIQVLAHSVNEVRSNDLKVKKLGEFIIDFKKTFNEISEASHNIANMAEELNDLNNEIGDKF